ncbi:hypothetical protein [Sphingomonas faeni]|uniref:hypothetical protein n=1 Tax=Sphingomonas faeni TaxID=185950 RepID=UPI0020BFB321|nr:hypothetical protein [Sphingomonas faeni]MCK8457862.1 hypothetical protein [Sphingomonas faeni]
MDERAAALASSTDAKPSRKPPLLRRQPRRPPQGNRRRERRPDLSRSAVQFERQFRHPVQGPDGKSSNAQIEAFEDTWHWNDTAEDAFDQVARSGNTKAFDLLNAMRGFLGDNDMMAYLAMMAVRLLELHRVAVNAPECRDRHRPVIMTKVRIQSDKGLSSIILGPDFRQDDGAWYGWRNTCALRPCFHRAGRRYLRLVQRPRA